MIPSLVEQILAARIPTKAELREAAKSEDRINRILEAVRAHGNVTASVVVQSTKISDRIARELLAELVEQGKLYTWQIQKGSNKIRMWGVTK